MFKSFRDEFGEGSGARGDVNLELLAKFEERAHGITELLRESGGASFEEGLYRLHPSMEIEPWTKNVEAAFPQYEGKIVCFGFDWLGRHFALDQRGEEGAQWPILMIEPGSGEAMKIPVSFADFHNVELVEYADDALAEPFYDEWLDAGGASPSMTECISYKKPLFLGGEDTIENLELSDMDVYWHLCSELLHKKAKG